MASRDLPLVLHVVHSLEGGGTERVLIELLRSFDYANMRHAVVTQRGAGSLAVYLPDQVSCRAIQAMGRTRTAFLSLARITEKLRPSIIHARNVCTWADCLGAAILNPAAKLVLGFHGLQNGGTFSRRDRLVARMATRFADSRFASVSERGCEDLSQQCGVPQTRITHLPNGVDCRRFVPSEKGRIAARQAMGCADHDVVLGTVGSLTPIKGHAFLFDSFARIAAAHRQTHLLVVGAGALEQSLKAQVSRLNLTDRITFTGQRDDTAQLMQGLDIYVCSSHSEGVSNALLEAMATGLPVITTNVGDHTHVVRQGIDGLVVGPGQIESLSDAMNRLIVNKAERTAMGQNARLRAEDYDFPKVTEAYESYYRTLITHTANSSRNVARICLSVSKSVISAGSARVAQASPLQ